MSDTTITNVLNAVRLELEGATAKFPPMRSAHEASAIIREELEEFWEAVKTGAPPYSMAEELIQIAAMCARALRDLDLMRERRDCPMDAGFVSVDWCEAQGHKIDIAMMWSPRCSDVWCSQVRAECCRVYFEEKEKKEEAK